VTVAANARRDAALTGVEPQAMLNLPDRERENRIANAVLAVDDIKENIGRIL
jgi:hypothetical protein